MTDAGSPVYLAGLDLRGRRVLVAGAGGVAERRVSALLDAGADVLLVAPTATPALAGLAASGRLRWERRRVLDADVDGAWFVQALTDDPATNAALVESAALRRVFCVRGDDGRSGTARTPASGATAGLTIGVVGDRNPRRSAAARDAALDAVRAWAARGERPRGPGETTH